MFGLDQILQLEGWDQVKKRAGTGLNSIYKILLSRFVVFGPLTLTFYREPLYEEDVSFSRMAIN